MLKDELERIENHIRHTHGHKYESTFEWKLTSEIRTLQQQNKQLVVALEDISNMPPHPPMARAKARHAIKSIKGESHDSKEE